MKRIATALVLLPLAVGAVFAGPQWEWAFKALLGPDGLAWRPGWFCCLRRSRSSPHPW
jgi:hypothetical protein